MKKMARKRLIAFVMAILMTTTLVSNVGYNPVAESDSYLNEFSLSDVASETDAREANPIDDADRNNVEAGSDTDLISEEEGITEQDTTTEAATTETSEEVQTETETDVAEEQSTETGSTDKAEPVTTEASEEEPTTEAITTIEPIKNIDEEIIEELGLVGASEQDITNYFNEVQIFVEGQPYDSSKSYPADTVFTIKLKFAESNGAADDRQFDIYEEYVYQLPSTLNLIEHTADIICNDDNEYQGQKIGWFKTEPSTGKVYVYINSDYSQAYGNCACWLTFQSTLNLAEDQDETLIEFPTGGESVKIPIKIDAEPRIDGSKVATYNPATHSAHYTITLNVKNGQVSNVNVSDIAGADLEFTSPISYTINGVAQTPIAQPSGNNAIIGLGTLDKNSVVVIEYDAHIKDSEYKADSVDDVDNTANVTGDYTFQGESKQINTNLSYDLKTGNDLTYNWVKKSTGSVDSVNGTVTWTVDLNQTAYYPLNNYTFTDTVNDTRLSFTNPTSVDYVKKDSSGNTVGTGTWSITPDSTGSISIPFDDSDAYSYQLTYKTNYAVEPTDVNNISVSNTAKVTGDGVDKESVGTAVLPGISTGISKKGLSYKDNTYNPDGTLKEAGYVEWQFVIDVPKAGLSNAYIYDEYPSVYYKGAMVYADGISDVSVTANNGATISSYHLVDDPAPGATGFYLYFNSTDAEHSSLPSNSTDYKVTVSYKMALKEGLGSESNSGWMNNRVKLHVLGNEIPAEATVQIQPPAQTDKEVKEIKGKQITYVVKLDPGQVGLGTDVILKDKYDSLIMTYVAGSAVLHKSENKYYDNAGSAPVPAVNDSTPGELEFSLGTLTDTYDDGYGNPTPYTYYLYYTLEIKDEKLAQGEDKFLINNEAELYINGDANYISKDTNSYEYTNNIFDKTKTSNPTNANGNKVMFSLNINPDEVDMIPASDDITIHDRMSSALRLSLDDVVIKKVDITYENGYAEKREITLVKGTDYTIRYDSEAAPHDFYIDIPNGDEKNIVITYGAYLNGIIGDVVSTKNEAEILGTTIHDATPDDYVTITKNNSGNSEEGTGASGSKNTIRINKSDSAFATKFLPGAEFALYEVDITQTPYTLSSRKATYSTDAQGVAIIEYNGFKDLGVYLLREIKAPTGYKLSTPSDKINSTEILPTDYVFVYQDGTSSPSEEWKEKIRATGYEVINAGKAVVRTNNRKGLTVTADKKYLGGQDLTEGQFTFKLEECDSAGNIKAGGQSVTGTNEAAVYDAVSGYATAKITFEDLTYEDLDFSAGQEYTYYYLMSEVNDAQTDVKYDSTTRKIKVIVKYNDTEKAVETFVDGAMDAVDTYDSGKTFTNIYEGNKLGKISLKAKKTVLGKTMDMADVFDFKLEQIEKVNDTTPIEQAFNYTTGGITETAQNATLGGEVSFPEISITKVGKYYFLITEVSGTKSSYTYDGNRYIIEIEATQNGLNTQVLDLFVTNAWKQERTGIDSYAPGTSVTYLDGAGIEFVNKYKTKINIEITKEWLDGGLAQTNSYYVKVRLTQKKNGSEYSHTDHKLGYPGSNRILIADKPVKDGDDTYTYELKELGVYDSSNNPVSDVAYKSKITGSAETNYLITNTLLTSVKVEKVWISDSDYNDKNVTYTLYADGNTVATKTVGSTHNWGCEFTNLPKYNPDNTEIKYTVVEAPVEGYVTTRVSTAEGFKFTNTQAKTSFNLKAQKEFLFSELNANEFEFDLYNASYDGTHISEGTFIETKSNGVPTQSSTVPDNRWSAPVAFTSISTTVEGSHYYILKEKNGTNSNIAYDNSRYVAKVDVVKASDNSLSSSVTYYKLKSDNTLDEQTVKTPVFTNSDISETKVIITGKKKVVIKDSSPESLATIAKNFRFALYKDNLSGTPTEYTSNDSGIFTFSPLTYTASDVGTKTYYVKEIQPAPQNLPDGFTYDDHVYKITFDIQNTGGNLTATTPVYTRYDSDDVSGVGTPVDDIEFVNKYSAQATLVIKLNKLIAGYSDNGTYNITVTEAGRAPITVPIPVTPGANSTGTKTTSITYKIEGTTNDVGRHTYIIKETGTSTDSMTYDDTEYTLIVDVSDNGDGTLKVEPVVYKNGDTSQTVIDAASTPSAVEALANQGLTFSNVYTAPNEISFVANKKLTVVDEYGVAVSGATKAVVADDFSFTLSGGNIISPLTVNNGKASDGTDTGDATKAIFNSIPEFDLSDVGRTYIYTLKENTGTNPSYTYDTTFYEIEVYVSSEAVTDAGGNPTGSYTIKTTPTYYKVVGTRRTKLLGANAGEQLIFDNKYKASGSVDISAIKEYKNAETLAAETLTAGQFEFTLSKDGTVIQTAYNDALGIVSFAQIDYTYADYLAQQTGGPYIYLIKEVNKGNVNTLYSDKTYSAVVYLKDDNTGALFDKVDYYEGEVSYDTDTHSITGGTPVAAGNDIFTNYKREDKVVSLEAKKELTGRTLVAGQFNYVVKNNANVVVATGTNDAAGNVTFSNITLSPAVLSSASPTNPILFYISEVNDGQNGFAYDSTVYTAKVVPIPGTNGSWTIATKYYDADDNLINNLNDVKFTNTYTAAGEVTLEATKSLIGDELIDGKFNFRLEKLNGTEWVTVAGTTNRDGKISYKLNYNQSDIDKTYVYRMYENTGAANRDLEIRYDDTKYYVAVKVSDNGDGTLSADKSYYSPEAFNEATHQFNPGYSNYRIPAINFVNIATTSDKLVLQGKKILDGKTLIANQFTFKLEGEGPRDSSGVVTSLNNGNGFTAKNDGSGNFVFPAIKFTDRDVNHTYVMTISEVDDHVPGYTYVANSYTVNVNVTLNGTDIVATPSYKFEGASVPAITFRNTYEAAGEAKVNGLKVLSGKTLDADAFEFGIYTDEACTTLVDNAYTDDNVVTNTADGAFEFTLKYTNDDLHGATEYQYDYYIKEIAPVTIPVGYVYDSHVYKVTVKLTDGGTGRVDTEVVYPDRFTDKVEFHNTYTDKLTELTVKKLDMAGNMLAGAELAIFKAMDYDSYGTLATPVERWTTGATAKLVTDRLKLGEKYVLAEISAPEGYKVAEPIRFKVDNYANISLYLTGSIYVPKADTTLALTDKVQVKVNKVDDGNNPVANALLALYEVGSNTAIEAWTSGLEAYKIDYDLVPETEYVIAEIGHPNGYEKAANVYIKIDAAGKLYTKVNGVYQPCSTPVIKMVDNKQWLAIKKTDLVTGSEIKDARLQITDSADTVKYRWTSSDTQAYMIEVSELVPREEYTFTEITAPFGYETAESIKFYVDEDGRLFVKNADATTYSAASDNIVNMQDKPLDIGISKLGLGGEALAGARLSITDVNGNRITGISSWTSNGTLHKVPVTAFNPNTEYLLVEEVAPTGYAKIKPVKFKFDATSKLKIWDGNVYTDAHDSKIVVTDEELDVTISKQDISGDEVEGATLTVKDSNGNVVDTWISDNTSHAIGDKLNAGAIYTLEETAAPDGYAYATDIKFRVNDDGSVSIYNKNTSAWEAKTDTEVVMVDEALAVTITKQDISGDEVKGALLVLKDENDVIVDTWISSSAPHDISSSLKADTAYTLIEKSAPKGYAYSTNITFRVEKDGTISIYNEEKARWEAKSDTDIVMVDEALDITISKENISGKEVKGATLTLKDSEGNVVDTWVSGKKPHNIGKKVNAGSKYTLEETSAPDGYVYATDITFKVNKDGSVSIYNEKKDKWEKQSETEVVMVDEAIKVTISKQDISGDEIEGATLTLKDESGEIIEIWTSGKKPHNIGSKLKLNETYILEETAAPAGYTYASDIKFKVNEDGSISIYNEKKDKWEIKSDTEVVMIDEAIKMSISKQDISGDEIEGATLTLKDSTGNVVESWTSGKKPHKLGDKLTAGNTYILEETAAPSGYSYAADIKFKVNKDGSIKVYNKKTSKWEDREDSKVVMVDEAFDVKISKQDISGDEVKGAKLTLKVKDENGNYRVVETWTSGKKPHIIETKLDASATYILEETSAPEGYKYATDIKFRIKKDGTVSVYDSAKKEWVDSRDNTVVMVDEADITESTIRTEFTESTATTELTTETVTTESSKSHSNVKTGDASPIMVVVVTMFVAGLGLIVLLLRKKEEEE